MPLSHFSVDLQEDEAYDKDKLPFVVDITAFFRIADYRQVASRIEDSATLQKHLTKIVQSAVRSIPTKDTLDEIMTKTISLILLRSRRLRLVRLSVWSRRRIWVVLKSRLLLTPVRTFLRA